MKILLALLLGMLLAGSRGRGQVKTNDHDWIDGLKKTPVAKLETGLPQKPFDQWLSNLTHSAPPKYDTIECETSGAGATAKCILVKADAPPLRALELTFAVSAEDKAHAGEMAFTFVRGTIGPSDPRSKQPTRLIRKLGELETMLK